MKKPELTDLSFFKFPQLTQEAVNHFVVLVFLVALTIILTAMIQHRLLRRKLWQAQRQAMGELLGIPKAPQSIRATLHELKNFSSVAEDSDLLRNAQVFEEAVEKYLEARPPGIQEPLMLLRRHFHMTAMNAALELVSTRQLIKDLPVRLVINAGENKLDLYTSLLGMDNQFLILNLPKEISESETQAQETRHLEDLIDRHPQAQLIFWRENDGETLFPVHLERVKSGGLSVLRAAHVFRQPGGHRSNYRLTVNLPITYQYLSLEEISRTTRPPKPASQEDGQPAPEKGRIIDLSFRGAAFVCNRSLAPGGLVRLNFSIHNQPVTIIGEIIKTSVDKDDNWTHNMHVRGVEQGGKAALNQFLSREQIKRLREKEVFHTKTRQKTRPPDSSEKA